MRVTKAALFANSRKPIALKVRRNVLSFLSQRGVSLSSSPQLVITVGGDGTVLYSKKHYGVPYFSIGSSTSFICQADFSNWRSKLPRVLSSLKTEPRLLLSSSLNGKPLPLALNEVGIRNPAPRVLSLHIAAGKRHFAFRADGMLFSTPTGSPAYCYSCGGKEMKKNARNYQAVAISPFRRLFPPTIFPASTACTLRFSGRERAQLFIDGQVFGSMTEKDTLVIRAAKRPFLFAKV